MYYPKRKYAQAGFKLVLLAVYFAFFSVQLLLRFDSSLARQSLDGDGYKFYAAGILRYEHAKCSGQKVVKNKFLSYLNKRFHPKDALIAPPATSDFVSYYIPVVENSYFRDSYIAALKIKKPSFRGPPSC
jgi:hypothetical protein